MSTIRVLHRHTLIEGLIGYERPSIPHMERAEVILKSVHTGEVTGQVVSLLTYKGHIKIRVQLGVMDGLFLE